MAWCGCGFGRLPESGFEDFLRIWQWFGVLCWLFAYREGVWMGRGVLHATRVGDCNGMVVVRFRGHLILTCIHT
jgi:hypothetical protein